MDTVESLTDTQRITPISKQPEFLTQSAELEVRMPQNKIWSVHK